MSPFSDCPRGIDAGAHVLKALPRDEDLAFIEHMAGCSACRLEVEALRPVVDTLPISAPQHLPPAALKSRIMTVVNAESELLRAAGPEADRPRVAAPKRRRFGFAAPLRPAFAGAFACALLGIGVVGGFVVQGSGTPETRTTSAWAKGPATARLVQTGDKASLELVGMPSPPKGQVYQVWLDKGDGSAPQPTHTLFNVRSDGRANVAIDESVKGVDQILVTAEPSGGSFSPTSREVITASPA